MNVKMFLNKVFESGKENSPVILTGLTLFGIASTGIAAYRAGLEAHDILELHKKEMADVAPGDKDAKRAVTLETTKKMAKAVAAPVIIGFTTGCCSVGSLKASQKKLAILSAAYKVAERSVQDLDGKMKEILGVKKTREIRDAIMKDKVEQHPLKVAPETIITNNGEVLCYDSYSERYFASNAMKIESAIRQVSTDCKVQMNVSLNEFYYAINASNLTETKYGDNVGWEPDMLEGYEELLPINISAQLTEDKRPCLCLDYDVRMFRRR